MTDFTKVQFDLQYSDHLNTYYESKAQAIKDKQEFLKIEFMGNLEESVKYFDQYPALKFRKRVMIIKSLFVHVCNIIISHPFFEFFIIVIILFNS
mgnify:CR=1 FL=1